MVAGLRVVDHDRDLAAEADGGRVRDGECEDRGHRRVRGVPAALEDLDPRLDGSGSSGHDRAVLARRLPGPGVAGRRLRPRNVGTERDGDGKCQEEDS